MARRKGKADFTRTRRAQSVRFQPNNESRLELFTSNIFMQNILSHGNSYGIVKRMVIVKYNLLIGAYVQYTI